MRRRSEEAEETVSHAPPRAQAHLIVGAVRVLAHKTGRPPSIEEVAELLGWSRELTGHLARGLEAHGIVQLLKSPFDVRLEIADHLAVEKLPVEDAGPGLKDEVDAFHEEFKKRQEELQNLFDSGEAEKRKKERLQGLEDELKGFKAPKRFDPFGGS
jgi:DNA-binding transcriptional regulator GbsR (MarR family)